MIPERLGEGAQAISMRGPRQDPGRGPTSCVALPLKKITSSMFLPVRRLGYPRKILLPREAGLALSIEGANGVRTAAKGLGRARKGKVAMSNGDPRQSKSSPGKLFLENQAHGALLWRGYVIGTSEKDIDSCECTLHLPFTWLTTVHTLPNVVSLPWMHSGVHLCDSWSVRCWSFAAASGFPIFPVYRFLLL